MRSLPMGSMLGDAIDAACSIADEQQQAATATEQATERPSAAASAPARAGRARPGPDVSGSSTVTAVETRAADGECMTVTDIVIVDGEETRAPKRMCRRPPTQPLCPGLGRSLRRLASARRLLALAGAEAAQAQRAQMDPDNPTCPASPNWSTYRADALHRAGR